MASLFYFFSIEVLYDSKVAYFFPFDFPLGLGSSWAISLFWLRVLNLFSIIYASHNRTPSIAFDRLKWLEFQILTTKDFESTDLNQGRLGVMHSCYL